MALLKALRILSKRIRTVTSLVFAKFYSKVLCHYKSTEHQLSGKIRYLAIFFRLSKKYDEYLYKICL